MAITLTAAQLAAAMRVGTSPEETEQVTRLLAYATEAISRHLGSAYADTPETYRWTKRRSECVATSGINRMLPEGPPTPTRSRTRARRPCCCRTGFTGRGAFRKPEGNEAMGLDRPITIRIMGEVTYNDRGRAVPGEVTEIPGVWASRLDAVSDRNLTPEGTLNDGSSSWRIPMAE